MALGSIWKHRESEKQEDGETEHNLMTNPCQLYRGWVSGEIILPIH